MDQTTEENRLDLRGVLCPMNFVHTKLKLEEMAEGQTLEVILDDGEAMRNVPRNVKADGHHILSVHKLPDNSYKLLIRRGTD
ncbi:MAG: sulfurtransferase TusA family protein [Chloroflexi bacterium]|nr:sulfurtransferase TusA family protein [Chloroflexota bacterium]